MKDSRFGLCNDLYQLTMTQGFWQKGSDKVRANFHLFLRSNPFNNSFSVFAGLGTLIEALENFRYDDEELHYLSSLTNDVGGPIFSSAFLDYLRKLRLDVKLWAMEEGTICFAHEPLLRVEGSLLHCQLLESLMLNIINFQTLIATKAVRICMAAGDDPVIEFGLRRAQGVDGALSASRAAHIGGCVATSNVMAGKKYALPVVGTHAHSWVLSFPSELEAFKAYIDVFPDNIALLIDTYNTLEGADNAMKAVEGLDNPTARLKAVRLDSGDLTYFSKKVREKLDKAGFRSTKIIASNDLDENLIEHLKFQQAKIDIWGVGTKLVTAHGDPNLQGVYKLTALEQDQKWVPKIKISNDQNKISHPGVLQVRRFTKDQNFIGDAIYALDLPFPTSWTILDPTNPLKRKNFNSYDQAEDLLQLVFENGQATKPSQSLQELQKNCRRNIHFLDSSLLRLINPHKYPAGLEKANFERKLHLIEHRLV